MLPGREPITKLRILIIDDEALARERLKLFLSRHESVHVVGECADGLDAPAAIGRERPDIVFLDVQMPGASGFEVLQQLSDDHRPQIVFVTAHESFAVQAFAAQAVDYLLKPFDDLRLAQALTRAIDQINLRRTRELAHQQQLPAPAKGPTSSRLAVRTDRRVLFVAATEIIWVEASNNSCVLHLQDGRRIIMRETLSAVQDRLEPNEFTRINRSALVRTNQVKELQLVTHGDYTVLLQNGTQLPLSRKLRGRLDKFVATKA